MNNFKYVKVKENRDLKMAKQLVLASQSTRAQNLTE